MTSMRPTLAREGTPYTEITDRAPNHVWSRAMWGWGVRQAVTHTVYLQDDLRLCPKFWAVIEAMVRAVPNRILGLIANHPLSDRALAAGHSWFRMCETLGTGYVVPTVLMAAFLDSYDRLPIAEVASNCEDFLLSRWQYQTGRRSWCPVPTVIQTMDDIKTTNPSVDYWYRRSYIPWDSPAIAGKPITDITYWTPHTTPPDFGPTVGNDLRLSPGPFTNQEIVDGHNRAQRAEGKPERINTRR